MSIIKVPLLFMGSKGEKIMYTLFDSGATFSCLPPEHAEEIGIIEPMRTPLDMATASKGEMIRISSTIRGEFYYNDIRMSDEFMVVPGLSEEAIIGVSTMQKWRIKLDFEHDRILVDPKVAKFMLKVIHHKEVRKTGRFTPSSPLAAFAN